LLTHSNAEQKIALCGIWEIVYGAAKIGGLGKKHVGDNKPIAAIVLSAGHRAMREP
jgi:hypothetical protein